MELEGTGFFSRDTQSPRGVDPNSVGDAIFNDDDVEDATFVFVVDPLKEEEEEEEDE